MKVYAIHNLIPLNTILAAVVLLSLCHCQPPPRDSQEVQNDPVELGFKTPPSEVKPWLYWYWINNHISKEGITKDLEAMAEIGIGAALIGNIYLDNMREDGQVPMLSEEWKMLTQHAIREGGRLGVDIGLFNSPGWSQSGGPWNDEANSMRYLTSQTYQVKGGNTISMALDAPTADFKDVSLLAFPSQQKNMSAHSPFSISADQNIPQLSKLLDKNPASTVSLTGQKEVSLTLAADQAQTIRSLEIYPAKTSFMMQVNVFAEEKGRWKEIRSFAFDRRNAMDQLGFEDYPPVVVSFPEVTAKKFKLTFSKINATPANKEIGLAEIKLSPQAQLEYYVEKQLAKMHQTPLPLNDAYQWPTQAEPHGEDQVLNSQHMIDLTSLLRNGTLQWEAPAGDWTILRTGMTTTGIKNGPAAPNATGLEVDKINKKALQQHFDGFVGDILKSMPAEERKAFKYVVADSYETGSQNWTEGFSQKFSDTYGYDPKFYLPVLSGRIVNSVEASNRFLWDLRRLVADQVAYEYVGGLRELCEEHGLQMWLENYGHWGFPSEFLMYGGQSHLIGGEFWAEGDLGSIECRAASSAAHIYGKKQVSAESYTAAQKAFMRHPGSLKKRGDWSFTEGINHVVFHVYIQQAYDRFPGVNAWFGTEFNRNNTWFSQAKPWIDYQRRSQYMLQQGQYVADIAYFIGEDAPKMTGVTDPQLPKGYSFDYINAEVILNRLSVQNGRLTLPDGLSYRIMVLPRTESMRPELLEKIRELVVQGAVIMGNPPQKSPSLQNYGQADQKVAAMAKELWGTTDKAMQEAVNYGKGKVYPYMALDKALAALGTAPDFKTATEQPVLWIHRKSADQDIYFITNQSDETISFDAFFRLSGLQPALWDATTGNIRALPEYSQQGQYTRVPLQLAPAESGFVVFTKQAARQEETPLLQNFGTASVLKTIDQAWQVHFQNEPLGFDQQIAMQQLKDWTELEDESLKHFSGTATYKTSFRLEEKPAARKVFLDIGKANVMASIKLNGNSVGGLWTAPWQIDVTDYLKSGENQLEIAVTNLWVNQLIGDSAPGDADRKTLTLINEYKPGSALQASGLEGPIKLIVFDQVYGTALND
jgi:hypothetical protein